MNCKDCIHEKVCVIRGFPSAFKNTRWEKEPCDHFESKTEWISVAERLPDEEEKYLVVLEGRITIQRFNPRDEINKTWWKNYISHWMPLPEPPKGE